MNLEDVERSLLLLLNSDLDDATLAERVGIPGYLEFRCGAAGGRCRSVLGTLFRSGEGELALHRGPDSFRVRVERERVVSVRLTPTPFRLEPPYPTFVCRRHGTRCVRALPKWLLHGNWPELGTTVTLELAAPAAV